MRFLTYDELNPAELEPAVEKVRLAIERDDFRTPDVKKLTSGPYYRAKLDGASRLLLQFVVHQGRRACLALEVIRNHDYARSRFLRGAPVDEQRLLDPGEPQAVEAQPIRYLHSTRSRFHLLDKPLSFDDAQEELLRRRPPLVIVGAAGTGKSALMLQCLRNQAGRGLYVTESSWLAQAARALYLSHGWDPGDREVDFLSYSQLLETIEVPAGRPVTFRDFRSFFERHQGKLKFATAHQCFEELRGVVTADPEGLLGLEAYLALGIRQSIFQPEQRAALHALLPAWQQWMEAGGLYEPNLCAHAWLEKASPRYDFVVIDEVQDLTPVQLSLILRTLAKSGSFVLGGDSNQIVHPNFFSWAKVKTLFWRGQGLEEARDIAILDVSYRNSEAVTQAANALLKLKHARFGSVDRESNYLMRAVGAVDGEVRALRGGSAQAQKLAESTRGSAKVAVVVLRDEDKEEARRQFRTPLVFSIHEAKGLEYANVILFRLVASERSTFQELCEGISPADLEGDSLEYRRAKDKADRSLEAFKFYVNALYVGLTRAVENAWLIEDDPGHPLLGLLGIREEAGVASPSLTASSVEEWQREARRLEQQGKLEQAEAIRASVLRTQPVPWTVLGGEALEQLAQKGLDPKGVSSKARRQLFDYACFHQDRPLGGRLADVGFADGAQLSSHRGQVCARLLAPYEARSFKEVLWQTERHGVDHRTTVNLTPLMMAAYAGNLPLVEALLARGARVDVRDHLGQLPVHWCLRRAFDFPQAAQDSLGAMYDLLAPPAFEVQVGGKLVQIGRELGEYLVFQLLFALWARRYSRYGRVGGLTAKDLSVEAVERFPEVILRQTRKERTYLNHVLARSEVDSSYPTSRRLWRRERQGHYVPNPELSLKVAEVDGTLAWRNVLEVLNLEWTERHLDPRGSGRLWLPGSGGARRTG